MKPTLTDITRQVADEWGAEGKLTVPPDIDTTDEQVFWNEVQRRQEELADS